MKNICLLLLSLVVATVAHAQRIQVVDTDGLPIAAVCVTNERGQTISYLNQHDFYLSCFLLV